MMPPESMTTDKYTQQRQNSSTIVDTANGGSESILSDVVKNSAKVPPVEQKLSSSHSFITIDDAMSFDSHIYSNSHSEPLTLAHSLRIQACQEFQQIMKLYKKKNKNEDNDDDNNITMDFDSFTLLLQDLNYPKMEKVRELFNQLCDEINQAEQLQRQQDQKQNEADDCRNHLTYFDTEKREEHTQKIIGDNDLRLLYDFSLPYSQKRCISQEFIDIVNETFELSASHHSSNDDDDDRNSHGRSEAILKDLSKRRFSMTAGEFLDKVRTTDATKRSKNCGEIHDVLNVTRLNKHEFLNVVFNGLDQITNKDTYYVPDGINYTLLDPALTTKREFVSKLEEYALSHDALTHHLLQNLESIILGKQKTIHLLLLYLKAYSHFTMGFTDQVALLIHNLENYHHKDILRENLQEEMGIYDDDTLLEINNIIGENITNDISGVPHRQLYQQMVSHLEQRSGMVTINTDADTLDKVASPLRKAKEEIGDSVEALLGTLYFGSELIVPKLYNTFIKALRQSLGYTNKELVFFLLHVDMDQDHADDMKEIVIDHSNTYHQRLSLVKSTEFFLNARVKFYESVIENCYLLSDSIGDIDCVPASNEIDDVETVSKDLILESCVAHICPGSHVLEINRSSPSVSRSLIAMGAAKVVAIHEKEVCINNGVINNNEYHIHGEIKNLRKLLQQNNIYGNIITNDVDRYTGFFDLCVAALAFKDTTVHDMHSVIKDIFLSLKPGGHFVFNILHPLVVDKQQYFSGSNHGPLSNQNDKFKTIEDYFTSLQRCGFEFVGLREGRAGSHSIEGVTNCPRCMCLKVRKPFSPLTLLSMPHSIDALPKMITWTNVISSNFETAITVDIPSNVEEEVMSASLKCFHMHLDPNCVDFGNHVSEDDFFHLRQFGKHLRKMLIHETGAVVVKGIDFKRFVDSKDISVEETKIITCAKLAYYFICRHIGAIDGSARGVLFDVMNQTDKSVDSVVKDNALFSEVDTESGWHTDGASKIKVYDVIGLMCIHKSLSGGNLQVTNAVHAYHTLKRTLPKFLLYELVRPLVRDILENSEFKNPSDRSTQFLRSPAILCERIRQNTYPIFFVEGERMRFRYMRYWIETGHKKAGYRLPAFLQIAMDLLDEQLDKECTFDRKLEPGEMIFVNNALLAHNRTAFTDTPDAPKRHQVRVWIQTQKADYN